MKNSLKINRLGAASLFILLLIIGSGCKDEKADYINLSVNSFTFNSDGKEELLITVDASQKWNVEYNGNWIIEKDKTSQSLTVGVTPTQSGMVRSAKLVFRSGQAVETVDLSQLGTNVNFSLLEANSMNTIMSPGGKYVAGISITLAGNLYKYSPFIIDVATGTKTVKPDLNKSYIAAAISDNGCLILLDEAGLLGKYYDESGNLQDFRVPDGFDQPQVGATSADGKIFVGFVHKKSDNRNYPVKWVEGVPQLLEMPEKSLLGEPVDIGAYARGCSADGSVIYGAIADDQTALYWKEDGKVHFLGEDQIKIHSITTNTGGYTETYQVADRPIFYADHTSMSPNGKLLATTYLEITTVNKDERGRYYPAYVDMETNKLVYIKDLLDGFEDGTGLTISDDGILSFCSPSTAFTDGYVYDIHTNTITRSQDYLRDKYGIILSTNGSIINRFSDDHKTLIGTNMIIQASVYQYWYLNIAD